MEVETNQTQEQIHLNNKYVNYDKCICMMWENHRPVASH
jgi:hypothetical protein